MNNDSMLFAEDPWYKSSFTFPRPGSRVKLHLPHDVFSTQKIDEGTLLLIDNIPTTQPESVLDMGCGYGALSLPLAERFPKTHFTLVDRDLLAVHWSTINALELRKDNGLMNVTALGSLGFRDLPSEAKYDWILCNVPARIGRPFMRALFSEGCSRLNPEGEIRVVVITDLAPLILEIAQEDQWPIREVARGARHVIFSLAFADLTSPMTVVEITEDALYLRDQVTIGSLRLDRPFDLGGDDQRRLRDGIPLLLDALPRQIAPDRALRVLNFRCGYGATALTAKVKWPQAEIVAVDRDLLGTTFTRRNARRLGVTLDVRENAHFPGALGASEKFDLIIGELSPSAGEKVAHAELNAIARHLAPGGNVILLCLEKLEKDWVQSYNARAAKKFLRLIARNGYAILN